MGPFFLQVPEIGQAGPELYLTASITNLFRSYVSSLGAVLRLRSLCHVVLAFKGFAPPGAALAAAAVHDP